MVAGSLTYSTELDTKGFQKGINDVTSKTKSAGSSIKSIVAGLGITKLISKAFQTITSNLDSAVQRIDVLNNFPKVMSNLGIGVEESSEAIQTLNKNLEGLPTTLNEGASAVQRFTSRNGDVKKSVEIFTAVNNAILAGGASADIQSTAMEQLAQAYAKGKPDMMEWRSLMTAMPAQLKQVAQAMGYVSTDELGEALRNGSLSMDDFIDTMVELNTKGTGEFKSFEEQAKNSTGGIGTSIKNMQTAVVRGISSIVQSIDEGLKNAGFGGIAQVITNIGKVFESVFKKIGQVIKGLIPTIKNIYDWIVKNQNLLKGLAVVVLSVVVAIKAYNLALLAMKGINIATSIASTVTAFIQLIPSIKSAKDAMLLLNMAMDANPVGVIIAGVTALVAVLAIVHSELTKNAKEMKEYADSVKESRTAYEDYQRSLDETAKAELSHINQVERLKDELTTIVDENGKVKEGYEDRANYILNELNNALGTEYKLNGDIIESYQTLQEEIDKTIQKKKAEIIMESYSEKYKKAIEDEENAVKTLAEARQKAGEVAQRWNVKDIEGLRQKRKAMEEIRDAQVIKGFDPVVTQAWYDEIDSALKAYDDASQTVVNINKDKVAYEEKAVQYEKGLYNEMANSVKASVEDYSNSSLKTIKESLQEQSTAYQTYKSIFDETQDQVAKELMENAQANIQALSNELVARTSTIGDLGQDEIEAWRTLSEKSYSEYEKALSKMSPEMQNKIRSVVNVVSSDTSVQGATSGLGNKANSGFNNNVDGSKWGTDLIKNIASALSSPWAGSIVGGAASKVAGWISQYLHFSEPDVGPLSDFHTYMPDMIDNMVKGIYSNEYKVDRAVTSLAQDIKDKMQDAVNLETGKMNASANIKASSLFDNTIVLNASFDGNVELENTKVGRILAPSISRTIKAGGLV